MADNKNPKQKQPGEKPPGKYHFNPGNMSGKTLEESREQSNEVALALDTSFGVNVPQMCLQGVVTDVEFAANLLAWETSRYGQGHLCLSGGKTVPSRQGQILTHDDAVPVGNEDGCDSGFSHKPVILSGGQRRNEDIENSSAVRPRDPQTPTGLATLAGGSVSRAGDPGAETGRVIRQQSFQLSSRDDESVRGLDQTFGGGVHEENRAIVRDQQRGGR